MSIAVSKSSWHYKLFLTIRSLWGVEKRPPTQWSLCPYFHTLLWGSLGTVIAMPFAVLGLLFLKIFRKAYKWSDRIFIFRWFASICDKTNFSNLIEVITPKEKINLLNGLMSLGIFGFLATMLAGVVVLFNFIFIKDISGTIGVLKDVVNFIMWLPLIIGYILFNVFWFIGFLFNESINCIIIAANWTWIHLINGVLLNVYIWAAIGKWVLFLFIISAACLSIFLLIRKFLETKIGSLLISFLEITANGFAESRARRKIKSEKIENERQRKKNEKLKKQLENLKKKLGDENLGYYDLKEYKKENTIIYKSLDAIAKFGGNTINAIIGLYSKKAYINDKPVEVLGPIGMAVEFFKGKKESFCPVLSFANENDISSTISASNLPIIVSEDIEISYDSFGAEKSDGVLFVPSVFKTFIILKNIQTAKEFYDNINSNIYIIAMLLTWEEKEVIEANKSLAIMINLPTTINADEKK